MANRARQWIDFVLYADESNRVQTRAERLDVTHAVDVTTNGWDAALHPRRVRRDDVERSGDPFEALEISEHGDVFI